MTLSKEYLSKLNNIKDVNEIQTAIENDLDIKNNRKKYLILNIAYSASFKHYAKDIDPKDIDPYVMYTYASSLLPLIETNYQDVLKWVWDKITLRNFRRKLWSEL